MFITTSGVSSRAIAEVEKYQGKIILIDDIRLTELVLEYGVAVQKAKVFTLYEVDEDFVEES